MLNEQGHVKWSIERPFGVLRAWGGQLVWFGEIAGTFYAAELGWNLGEELRRRALRFVPMIELSGGGAVGYERDAERSTLLRGEIWSDGRPLWSRMSFAASEEWDSGAAATSDRVIVGSGQHLVCLSLETGDHVWRASMEPVEVDLARGKMWPVIHGDRVISNGAWGIIGFDINTGEKAWHYMHPCWKAVADGRVYCLSKEYAVLDARTGKVLVFAPVTKRIQEKFGAKSTGKWRGGMNFARPTVWGDHIYVGDDDGRLWAIEKETGEPVWFHKPKGCTGYLNAEPVIDGNRLFITSFSMDSKRPPALYCYERVDGG